MTQSQRSNKEIICLVGPSGAGKDEVVNRIQMLTGIPSFSLSDQVRRQAKQAGLENPTRGDLQIFANEVRKKGGNGVFARFAIPGIMEALGQRIMVNGVRHPDEINKLRGINGASVTILGITAGRKVRFNRVLQRGRSSDPKNWDEFLKCDIRENGTLNGVDGQQNYQCLNTADAVIHNEGSLIGLEYCTDTLLDEYLCRGSITNREMGKEEHCTDEYFDQTHLIIFNGIHAAGKSTLGKFLANELDITYIPEIGGQLRQEVDYNALESSEAFDREVMRRELLRDHELQLCSETKFVVETWHTGNLAYAQNRSPEVTSWYDAQLARQCGRFNVNHVFVTLNDHNFLIRATEQAKEDDQVTLLEFFRGVEQNIREIYGRHSLPYREISNDGLLTEAQAQVVEVV